MKAKYSINVKPARLRGVFPFDSMRLYMAYYGRIGVLSLTRSARLSTLLGMPAVCLPVSSHS
jgi:hypothetical protein